MIQTTLSACRAALLTAFFCSPVSAQFLTSRQAEYLGLEEAWRGQLTVRIDEGKPTDLMLHVDSTRKRTFVDVVADGERMLRIPTDMLDRSGEPIGLDEAQRMARTEVVRLRRRGIEGEIQVVESTAVFMYALGRDGSVQALDAETGRTLWTTAVGNPRFAARGIGANDRFVCTLGGGELHVLDSVFGRLLASEPNRGVISSGPLVANNRVFVFGADGHVEGYELEDMERDPYIESAAGTPLARARVTSDLTSMLWPTDSGFVYSMDVKGPPALNFRLPTSGQVGDRVVTGPDSLAFFAADSGQVYCVKAHRTGEVVWRSSVGRPVYESPFIAGDYVFVKTVYGNLHCLNIGDGIRKWKAESLRIDMILGSDTESVFVRLQSGRLAKIAIETGRVEANLSSVFIANAHVNRKTDRLYLMNDAGGIQALRPIGSETPALIIPSAAPALEEEPAEEEEKQPATPSASPFDPQPSDPGENPFGDSDPFDFGGDDSGDPFSF